MRITGNIYEQDYYIKSDRNNKGYTVIQKTVSKEVQEAKIFSVEIDTTQDISCQDQCSIILQYALKGVIFERLSFLVKAETATGEGLFNLLKANLNCLSIDIQDCIGDSFGNWRYVWTVLRCASTYKRSCLQSRPCLVLCAHFESRSGRYNIINGSFDKSFLAA